MAHPTKYKHYPFGEEILEDSAIKLVGGKDKIKDTKVFFKGYMDLCCIFLSPEVEDPTRKMLAAIMSLLLNNPGSIAVKLTAADFKTLTNLGTTRYYEATRQLTTLGVIKHTTRAGCFWVNLKYFMNGTLAEAFATIDNEIETISLKSVSRLLLEGVQDVSDKCRKA